MDSTEITASLLATLRTPILDKYCDPARPVALLHALDDERTMASLSSSEVVRLRVAADIFNGSGKATVADILARLDRQSFTIVISAIIAAHH